MNVHNNQPSGIFPVSIGQYVFFPERGICVAAGYETFEAGGSQYSTVKFRPLTDLKTAHCKPYPISAATGIRLPAAAAQWRAAFSAIFDKRPRTGAGIWRLRAQAYQVVIKDGGFEEQIQLLVDVLGKKRSASFKGKTFKKIPAEIELSYSENEIAENALRLLAQEYAFVTGAAQNEAENVILSSVLVPGFAKSHEPVYRTAPAMMANAEFKDLFGVTIKEASKEGAVITRIADMKTPVAALSRIYASGENKQARFSGRSIQHSVKEKIVKKATRKSLSVSAVDNRAEKNSGESENKPRLKRSKGIDANSRRRLKEIESLPLENRIIFEEEERYGVKKGILRALLQKSARILAPDALIVVSQMVLRAPKHRLSLAQISTNMGKTPDEIIMLYDGGVENLRNHISDSMKKFLTKALRPYAENALRDAVKRKGANVAKPQRMVRIKENVRDKRRADLLKTLPQANIAVFMVEHNFSVKKGGMQSLFLTAARVLEADGFDAVSKSLLRSPAHRIEMAQLAAESGRTLSEMIMIRNGAVSMLKENLPERLQNIYGTLLRPYHQVVKKTPVLRTSKKLSQKKMPLDMAPLRSDLLQIYEEEKSFLVATGATAQMIMHAGKILEPLEYLIFLRTEFRKLHTRQSIHRLAHDAESDVRQIALLRNQAAGKLKDHVAACAPDLLPHPALIPVVPKIGKHRRSKKKAQPERNQMANTAVEESAHVAATGSLRTIFTHAVSVLEPEELSVLSKVMLRLPEQRKDKRDIAQDMGITLEDVIAIHNRASEKMRSGYDAQGSVLSSIFFPAVQSPVDALRVDHGTTLSEIYSREASHISPNVVLDELYNQGIHILEPDEYEVVIRMDLRSVKYRDDPKKVAEDKQVNVSDVFALRNRAVEKLKAAVVFDNPDYYSAPVFRPRMA